MSSFILGFLLGFWLFMIYFIWRMLRSDDWDDSNITNAVRLLSHVALHPEDFGKMYYIPSAAMDVLIRFNHHRDLKRPFHYISKDELSEVVDSRPQEIEREKEK